MNYNKHEPQASGLTRKTRKSGVERPKRPESTVKTGFRPIRNAYLDEGVRAPVFKRDSGLEFVFSARRRA